MKNREVLVRLPETEVFLATILYTDGSYEMYDGNYQVIIKNTWRIAHKKIYLSHGWGNKSINPTDTCLNDERPDLEELIAWEQIEKEILS